MYLRPLYLSIYLFSSLMFIAAAAQAETQTEYAVDIVVFEDSEARYLRSEQWLTSASTFNGAEQDVADAKNQTSLTKKLDNTMRPEIRRIDTSAYDLLDGAVKRLQVSKRYHILARKSWLQPGLDSKNAVDIEIATPGTQATSEAGSISGSVRIVLERYLHLYTDLSYHRSGAIMIQPASDSVPEDAHGDADGDANQLSANYIIKEHRRMRSRELHYIDHPLLGILIKIIPVETKIKKASL